jgi:hypothetical protein
LEPENYERKNARRPRSRAALEAQGKASREARNFVVNNRSDIKHLFFACQNINGRDLYQ